MFACLHRKSCESNAPRCSCRILLFLLTFSAILLLYVVAVWWGGLNQDEGWYLYAGRLVSEGQVPYRDFVTTQGPVMAYFYGLVYPLVALGGVVAGRAITAGLGLLSVILSMCLARRISRQRNIDAYWAVLLTAAFCGLNIYQVYFTAIVKTYALASVFMLIGLSLFARALHTSEENSCDKQHLRFLYAALAGICLAFAAGTRLSAAFLLPACWVPTLIRWFKAGKPRGVTYSLAGLLFGGTAGMTLVFVPFLLVAHEAVQFGLLDYHAARSVGSGVTLLAYKAGFVLRCIQAYWPLLLASILIPLGLCTTGYASRLRAEEKKTHFPLPLWICFFTVTVVHMLSVFPYDDYQVFLMPLVCIAVAVQAGSILTSWKSSFFMRACYVGAVLLLLLGYSLSSPLLQGWLLGPRDRIWWPLRTASSVAQLRRVGKMIRGKKTRRDYDETMITQDTYVAVEAGCRVPDGMEMGPFANFLDLSDEQAEQLNVLNRDKLTDLLSTADAAWAVYSGYGFAIQAPEVIPIPEQERESFLQILQDRFIYVTSESAFGQAMTTVHIYKKESR